MTTFLEALATSLHSKYGTNLSNHAIVFPTRRAGHFFLKYLATLIDKPVWTPAIVTMGDIFKEMSTLQKAEGERLVAELYIEYRKLKPDAESLDEFYFWGDMLINDFDDVDKYLADPSILFRNVTDLRKIDDQFGGLTPEQAEIVGRFWKNVDTEKLTKEKKSFLGIWSILEPLYFNFTKTLREKNIAYEGMIFRDAAGSDPGIHSSRLRWEKIHFAGFNALNECEKVIMENLKESSRACFYWDYDNSYIGKQSGNSAGLFLKENLNRFGNDMPETWNYDTFLSGQVKEVTRKVIETSSDNAQIKLIPSIIDSLPGFSPENAHQTAIILADENLLVPMLSSLPGGTGSINITMGFPLRDTSVYSLISSLSELQRNTRLENGITFFRNADFAAVMRHPLLKGLLKDFRNNDLIEKAEDSGLWVSSEGNGVISSFVFRKVSGPRETAGYLREILEKVLESETEPEPETLGLFSPEVRNEFIHRTLQIINRLDVLTSQPDLLKTSDAWFRIFEMILRSQSIPFSGEPLEGLQIMGLLETRAIDFRNLIIVSANEGILPSSNAASSFIPFSLREACGLPSINHRESVYAYHFFRLFHQAENITLIYNSNPEGLRSGEMSRFIRQMIYTPTMKPQFHNLTFEIGSRKKIPNFVNRTQKHQGQILTEYALEGRGRVLSPSAINTWIACRMLFYYKYVCGLKEPEEVVEEIDSALLGTILHDTIKTLYSKHEGKLVTREVLKAIYNNSDLLEKLIDDSLRKNYKTGIASGNIGNEAVVSGVIMLFLRRILKSDMHLSQFKIVGLESKVSYTCEVDTGSAGIKIKVGGTADRIDSVDGLIRIADYKTGNTADSIDSLLRLFDEARGKEADGWLQTLIYCEGYRNMTGVTQLQPIIYKLRKQEQREGVELLSIKASRGSAEYVNSYESVRDEFMEGLAYTLGKMFHETEPFSMIENNTRKCSWCAFRRLCLR